MLKAEGAGATSVALRDLAEAREQQIATSEILSVISQSRTDVQPVFDAIARSAVQLCDGFFSMVGVVDCDLFHVRAIHNLPVEWARSAESEYPARLDSPFGSVCALRERRVIQILDVQGEARVSPGSRERARWAGYRPWVSVPMLGTSGVVGLIWSHPSFFVWQPSRMRFRQQVQHDLLDLALVRSHAAKPRVER